MWRGGRYVEVQLYSGLYEIVHLTLNLIPLCLLTRAECGIPWAPEVFLAYGGNFRCWPKPHRNRKPREKSLWHPRKMRERSIEEVITSPNSPIEQFATTTTTAELRRETGSKFVYQRSDCPSKKSHSAIRHETDYGEVM